MENTTQYCVLSMHADSETISVRNKNKVLSQFGRGDFELRVQKVRVYSEMLFIASLFLQIASL